STSAGRSTLACQVASWLICINESEQYAVPAIRIYSLRIATLSAQNALTAELSLLDALQVADFSPQGNNGLYRTEAFAALPLWQQQSTWRAGACRPAPHALTGSAAPACAIVELLRHEPDKNYRAFRVTVRGYGSTSRSTVLLQAYAVL
ncbi:MAG: hypothetical protein VYC16_08690, partial [Pseudomonadota bacterium]|nr:hypothetical protein [Pseudomonadota bacterium]